MTDPDEPGNPLPPYWDVDWDRDRESWPESRRSIALGALEAHQWLREQSSHQPLDLEHLLRLHRIMFQRLFPRGAGKIRGPSPMYLPYESDFGRYKGVHYLSVPSECAALFATVTRMIQDLDRLLNEIPPRRHQEEVINAAAYTHCELVRIHPFLDGNGRTARMCITYFARRYGLQTLTYSRPGGEYLAAIATWLQIQRIEHFIDYLNASIQGHSDLD